MPHSIGLTGDVMLGRLVDEHQRTRSVEAVWGDVLPRLRSLDGLCINLECALSTRGEPWTETHRPFHFRADPDWAGPALERAGVDVAALANNHLMDYDAPALVDTLDALDDAGIAHAGAGRNREAARAPALVEVGDLTVVVVSFTDNTPEYAAGPDGPGVSYLPMDGSAESRETARAVLDRARTLDPDLLVASLHWGPNMVEVPDERYRAFGRWLVGEGVDLVHGHSAHVFQGVEVHEGVPILYDAGDFVDDYRVDDELRNDRSFLFEATVDGGRVVRLALHPVEIDDFAVHEAGEETARWCRDRMRERSRPFGTADDFERSGRGLTLSIPT